MREGRRARGRQGVVRSSWGALGRHRHRQQGCPRVAVGPGQRGPGPHCFCSAASFSSLSTTARLRCSTCTQQGVGIT